MCHGKRQLIQFFLIRIMTWSPSARKGSNEMSNKLTTSIMHKINFSSQRVYRGQKKKEGKRRGKRRHFGAKAFDWKEKRNVSISGYKMSVCFLRFASACLPCCCSKKKKWYVMNTNKQCLSPLLTPLALGKSCLSSCMVIEKKEAEATNICSDEATSKTISCETYRFVMWCDVKCDSRFGLFFLLRWQYTFIWSCTSPLNPLYTKTKLNWILFCSFGRSLSLGSKDEVVVVWGYEHWINDLRAFLVPPSSRRILKESINSVGRRTLLQSEKEM